MHPYINIRFKILLKCFFRTKQLQQPLQHNIEQQ